MKDAIALLVAWVSNVESMSCIFFDRKELDRACKISGHELCEAKEKLKKLQEKHNFDILKGNITDELESLARYIFTLDSDTEEYRRSLQEIKVLMEQKKSLKAKIAASKTEFDVAEKKVFDCQETYNKLVAKQDALINAERETKIYRDEVMSKLQQIQKKFLDLSRSCI